MSHKVNKSNIGFAHLTELKSLNSPPAIVKNVVEKFIWLVTGENTPYDKCRKLLC